MGDNDLFRVENEVIARARQTLAHPDAGGAPSPRDYQWLLDQYIRLCRQNRQLVQFGDRMQSAVNREIVALKRSKAENDALTRDLIKTRRRLVTILDSIDAHIYVTRIDSFEILFMNKKMVDDFKADFTGRKCHESFQRSPTPCVHCSNGKLLDSEGNPRDVYTWQGENPVTHRWYLNRDRAIQWVDGSMVKIRIATDITESKRHEEERRRMEMLLQKSQKFEAIATLAAGVAHDFNNLLMGVQGQASLLAFGLPPRHPHSEHTDAIFDYVQSAKDLTRQLLGLARGGKYEARPTDINRLVDKSAAMFGRTHKAIRIRTRLQDSSLAATADRRQIEQVLLNLLLNASQAISTDGEIHIETASVHPDDAFCQLHGLNLGPYVRIAVRDNGVGMDEATHQQVFDPFFTTKEKGRGTGLGLASAYGIVKNHSGAMTVHSRIGRGARFDIFLPRTSQPAEAESDVGAGVEVLTGHETILLIDDEQMIREVGKAMLEKLGYRVLVADGGERGGDLFHQQAGAIDLVILDMIMPGMGGGRTFERIRSIRPATPVLLCSGYARDAQAEAIMKRGYNGFIQKPFRLLELSAMLRNIMDRRQTQPTSDKRRKKE